MRPPGPVLSEEDHRVDSKHISILCTRLPGLVLSEEDCRVGSKHLRPLSLSLLESSQFVRLARDWGVPITKGQGVMSMYCE